MTLTYEELANFTGSTHYYVHPFFQDHRYTDGVHHLVEEGNAFWLLNDILAHQRDDRIRQQDFQVWTLRVDLQDRQGVLTCEDGNGNELLQQAIPYSDFPLPEVTLWLQNQIVYLPTEH